MAGSPRENSSFPEGVYIHYPPHHAGERFRRSRTKKGIPQSSMPSCVTISGRHARKSDRRKFNPCNRHQDQNTHFRRLIMAHNNKLAQARLASNTWHVPACAPFLRAAIEDSNNHALGAALTLLAQAISPPNTQMMGACASFFGMAVSTTDTLHMVAMPTILVAARGESNTQSTHAAALTLGLHRRPSEYPPRRRVGHHKSCGNTNMTANTQRAPVFPHSFLG